MFYQNQNGHQPPPYVQQPPYPQHPQQNNLPYGGYNGGGGGTASASSASGDAILEFPSPYGGPSPIYGGGYAPSGPLAGSTYGAPQQQSTYAPMPHFAPQQPQPQASTPPVQQPAPPPAGGKPLFQPSGMIRSRKPTTMSAPVESVLSPPSSANSAAASSSSPVPPLAASVSLPLVPSLSSDYEDYSLASAPPAYYQAYGPPAQNYGQQVPSHEYQVAPDYRVTAPPSYHQPPQQPQPPQQAQQQQQQQPTPYHSMPILPQNRLYPSFSAPGLLGEHTQQQQQPQQQQQSQHYPSSPQVPQQQHYHPAPQLSQSQPQITHHYQPAPQLQPQQKPPQQQQTAAAAEETKPGAAVTAVAATGLKVLPPLPPDRRRNSANLSPRQQRLKEAQQPQRVSSDPPPHHQMSELEEKLRERENKAKRRESVNVVVMPRRQLAGLSLNASAPTPHRPGAATGGENPEEKRRGSGPPAPHQASSVAPTTTTTTTTATEVEDLYVAPPSFVLQPESRRPLSTGGGGDNGAAQKEPEKPREDYNYYDLQSVHDSDSEEDSDVDDGGSGGGGDAEANYVANIELVVASADSPLPSGYALPDSGEWTAKAKAKPEGDKAGESPKPKAGPMRQSAKRGGNRWEIEFEELEVDKRIGQGAYGSVFKGKWRNTVVAIKTIRENMASFHEAKFKEFRGEAEMMMDMRPHTNVVQLFGVCMRPYMAIVVEFLEGGSLQELLQSKADIDLHMALKIALHAAAGVAHLHAEGICHRDLAARNLLLTSRNKDYLVVKVADFGLSRFTEDAEDNFTSCKVGPLKWMPPESLQEQKYSSKSDAWAMGVVLWEIFSRQEPFPGVSPVQVAIGVSSRGMCLRPPSSCPPEIARLMYDCWAYDPKERPDFRTIARTIEQVLDSNPENYNIVPNTGEPISCTHPKRQAPTKPAPPPRHTTTGQ